MTMVQNGYRRYGINFNKLVCQLVPHWLRGQRLIGYLQACVHPMQSVSDKFKEWAQQTRVDVSMTSQVIKLEWYFGRMFGPGSVRIKNFFINTNPIYHRDALSPDKNQLVCYYRDEAGGSHDEAVHRMYEDDGDGVSFVVSVDKEISGRENEIRRVIEKYKTANKTYKIEYR